MASPTSQKNLPISFVLDDGDAGITELALPIRPEDMTRTEPSRVSVTNTLDGAFLDSFGRGIANIQISGNTGWGSANRPDGAEKFAELRDDYIHKWHELRADRIEAGRDPDDVRLLFSDTLNNDYVAVVAPAPNGFTLKRSKSAPLLMYYSISLIVLSDDATRPVGSGDPEDWRTTGNGFGTMSPAGLASMSSSLSKISSLSGSLSSITASIGAFGANVMAVTRGVLAPIVSVAQTVTGIASQVNGVVDAAAGVALGVASEASRAGMALWSAVAAVESIPLNLQMRAMQIESEFTNLFCLLRRIGAGSAWDYDDFYGASNCSSTSGGRPLSPLRDVNGFEGFNAPTPAAFSFNQPATDGLRFLSGVDRVNPPSLARMSDAASAMTSGVTFYG